jgi:hypothetical protein
MPADHLRRQVLELYLSSKGKPAAAPLHDRRLAGVDAGGGAGESSSAAAAGSGWG